jgi:hypothetical protein
MFYRLESVNDMKTEIVALKITLTGNYRITTVIIILCNFK